MLEAFLFSLFISTAWAGGTLPAVNADLGCAIAGEAVQYDGSVVVCKPPTRPSTAFSGLGTCGAANQGAMKFVTDALAPVALATVAGGGAVKVGVTCNGTNWIVQ